MYLFFQCVYIVEEYKIILVLKMSHFQIVSYQNMAYGSAAIHTGQNSGDHNNPITLAIGAAIQCRSVLCDIIGERRHGVDDINRASELRLLYNGCLRLESFPHLSPWLPLTRLQRYSMLSFLHLISQRQVMHLL